MSVNNIRIAGKFISMGKLNKIYALETSGSREDGDFFHISASTTNPEIFSQYFTLGPYKVLSSRIIGM